LDASVAQACEYEVPVSSKTGPSPEEIDNLEEELRALQDEYWQTPTPELNYKMGIVFFKLGRYEAALGALEGYLNKAVQIPEQRKLEVQATLYQIIKIIDSAHPLYREGKKYFALMKYTAAKNSFTYLLKEDITESCRQEVEALLEEIGTHIGMLDFSCNVPDAGVYIDGNFVGTISHMKPIGLNEGDYTIEVKATDYEPVARTVTVKGGKKKKLSFELIKN